MKFSGLMSGKAVGLGITSFAAGLGSLVVDAGRAFRKRREWERRVWKLMVKGAWLGPIRRALVSGGLTGTNQLWLLL